MSIRSNINDNAKWHLDSWASRIVASARRCLGLGLACVSTIFDMSFCPRARIASSSFPSTLGASAGGSAAAASAARPSSIDAIPPSTADVGDRERRGGIACSRSLSTAARKHESVVSGRNQKRRYPPAHEFIKPSFSKPFARASKPGYGWSRFSSGRPGRKWKAEIDLVEPDQASLRAVDQSPGIF